MFTIYDQQTGEIQKIVSCPQTLLSLQFDSAVSSSIEGVFADDKYYIADGVAVAFPNKPSAHHTFDYTTKQWIDPRTLADFKAQQWTLIKQSRTTAEYAGFTWGGSIFDSDAISQNRITGAVTLAQMSSAFTIDWTLKDNTVRTLGQADMIAVGVALGTHVQTQFAKGQALRAQIEAATDQAGVEAVVW